VIASTSPLFVLNARAMLGEAPAFALQGAVALCAMGLVFPAREGTTLPWQRALYLVGLGASVVLCTLARGALLGPLPPLAAVGIIALLVVDARAGIGRKLGYVVLVAAAALAALVARDILGDSTEHSRWLGGTVTPAAPPTFDSVLEEVFHAFAPWSALLPIAIAGLWQELSTTHLEGEAAVATATRERRAESTLVLVALCWAAIAYGAQTLFSSRYGRDVTFLPVVALAALVALFLVRAEQKGGGLWTAGVAALFLTGLVLRDYLIYPSSPVNGLPLAAFDVPKVFNPRLEWALCLSAFAVTALLGFGAPSQRSLDVRAPYRFLREQWRRGLGHKLWIVGFALVMLGLLVFGGLAFAIPKQLGLNTLAVKWVRALLFVPPAIPIGILGLQLALFVFAAFGRFRLAPLLFTGACVGVYCAQGYLPALSEHFSPREIYETYNQLAKPGEALGEYHVGGRAATYYAKGKVIELDSVGALIDHLDSKERRWAAFPADDLASLDRTYRKRTGGHIVVADSRSARVLLGTNLPLEGKHDASFLEAHVQKAPPAKIQRPATVSFDDRIELLGYDLKLPHGTYVGAGESFTVIWYFRALKTVPTDYRIFIHIDGEGQRIHGDHDPLDGKYPVRLWDEGDVIYDEQTLDVPPSYRAGSYTIYLGFYSGESRLPIKSGPNDGENRANLGVLRIQ
jgi:hypothetical protein